jgi:hypothetical protein
MWSYQIVSLFGSIKSDTGARGMLECEGIFFTGATKPLRGMVRCGMIYI